MRLCRSISRKEFSSADVEMESASKAITKSAVLIITTAGVCISAIGMPLVVLLSGGYSKRTSMDCSQYSWKSWS